MQQGILQSRCVCAQFGFLLRARAVCHSRSSVCRTSVFGIRYACEFNWTIVVSQFGAPLADLALTLCWRERRQMRADATCIVCQHRHRGQHVDSQFAVHTQTHAFRGRHTRIFFQHNPPKQAILPKALDSTTSRVCRSLGSFQRTRRRTTSK